MDKIRTTERYKRAIINDSFMKALNVEIIIEEAVPIGRELRGSGAALHNSSGISKGRSIPRLKESEPYSGDDPLKPTDQYWTRTSYHSVSLLHKQRRRGT